MLDIIEKKIFRFILAIILILLYIFLPSFIVPLFYKAYNSSNTILADLARLEIYLILLCVFSVIFWEELATSLPKFFKNFKTNIKAVFKNWGKGFLFMIICNACILTVVGNIASNEAANRAMITARPISSILSVMLIGPICEELVFRANFRKIFNNKKLFCLVTGLIFGSIHMISSIQSGNYIELLYIVSYSGLGYYFAKAYYETDNIYTSMTIHIFHNSLTIVLVMLAMYLERFI
ncbi:MAG: CPBP family intramembrane metalloprotease [Bacilli bacterium]|nr:CPBP family intramembrane metalloprotease [Bacilli bacterium]